MHLTTPRVWRLWPLLVVSCVVWTVVELPARRALGYDLCAGLVAIDWLITLVLAIDVVVQWRGAAPSMGGAHAAAPQPAARLGWGVVDALAAVPWPLLPGGGLWAFLRFLKLIRVAQTLHRWQRSTGLYVNVRRLAIVLFWLLCLCHWLACGWLALGGIGAEGERSTRYLRALYWCVTTLTTVGYGDISPTTDAQIAYVILVTLVSMGLYSYIAGHIMRVLVYRRLIRRGVWHSQHPDRP